MRKLIKEQIESVLDTINEAHNELCQYIENGNVNSLTDILMACQQSAISAGTSIEESEGEGTDVVALLEEYCEMVYNIYVIIQNDNAGVSKNNIKEQVRKLSVIISKVLLMVKEIKIKKEIVFLPYKASMWDSLESVWMEATKDETCDAYVIPIPYFDKNPDGSLGDMHYEGEEYPDYVPIVNYKEYSIEKRKPDIIFIHNPYDQYNKVTSVAPQFYSKYIKQFTQQLVYIPYFVSGNTVAEHFCVLPGTIYADKVIVENEKVREIYVREYEKAFNRTGLGDKFLALGSPKYDRITRLKKNDFELPEEWAKCIKNKKIILYNTSVNNFINDTEKMLQKICHTIEVFQRYEKVVLWWRPHPLIEATLCSMRTQYYEEYKKIVDVFVDNGLGIFDDTPDLDRAIAYSDAYYGDRGSVMHLYKATGKPMMIQNLNIL